MPFWSSYFHLKSTQIKIIISFQRVLWFTVGEGVWRGFCQWSFQIFGFFFFFSYLEEKCKPWERKWRHWTFPVITAELSWPDGNIVKEGWRKSSRWQGLREIHLGDIWRSHIQSGAFWSFIRTDSPKCFKSQRKFSNSTVRQNFLWRWKRSWFALSKMVATGLLWGYLKQIQFESSVLQVLSHISSALLPYVPEVPYIYICYAFILFY